MQISSQQARTSEAKSSVLATAQFVTWPVLVEAVVLSATVCFIVFFIQWQYGFNWSDEGLQWYISQRTALGQVPLRDFFSYDPGRYYWSAFFFKLLHGNGLLEQIVANATFGAVGLAVIYFAVAKAQLDRWWRIALIVLLGVMIGFPRHKVYEQALSLISVAGLAFVLAKPASARRWFAYGIAAGLAGFIGRNSGLYFGLAALLLVIVLKLTGTAFRANTAVGSCTLGILTGYLPMLLMLCFVHGLAAAFYQSVLFTPHWQLPLPIPFPWHVHLKGLNPIDVMQVRAVSILCLAVPLTYVVAIWKWTKQRSSAALQLACAASLAGLPWLHHAFSRGDFIHIAQAILPFAIAVAGICSFFWHRAEHKSALPILCVSSFLILAAWLPYEPAIQHFRERSGVAEKISINGRYFYVSADQAEVMQIVVNAFRHCGSVDGSFLQAPYYPGLYAYLQTRSPFWELYFLYHRSDTFQIKEIDALQQSNVSLVLLNPEAAMDGRTALSIGQTNPILLQFILTNYRHSDAKLPQDFQLYYDPQKCSNPSF
ncbi:MAG TPA: hypothetical protein VH596_15540 [Terriglobales bacterium]|jgi:hypothetical protein